MPPVLKRQNTNREGEDLQEPLTLDALTAAKEAGKITLYGFIESPPCWKVKVLLEYYGVPFSWVTAYPGAKVEGLDNEYAKVPKLCIGETQINDSAVVVRVLAPLLAGEKLSAEQIELEKRNNIGGLMGALEKETAQSYFAIAAAARAMTKGWTSINPFKYVLPYVAGTVALPASVFLTFKSSPHGRDGPSLEHGAVFRKALGDSKFFHGDRIGPLDLTLYGTLACFIKQFESPPAKAVLAQCDLQAWYDRCDAAIASAAGGDAK